MEQILCEECRERPATHHLGDGNTGKLRDLCAECFESSVSPEIVRSIATSREALCQYCGGQPCAGGADILALITGVQQMKYMCMPCSREHNRYIQQELAQADPNASQQEQLAALRTLNQAADRHMKKWAAEKNSQ